MPDKKYYVNIPGTTKPTILSSEEYVAKKDILHTTYKDADVVEMQDYNMNEDVGETDFFVNIPGSTEPTQISAKDFAAKKDKIYAAYPNVQVSRIRRVDYFGDQLNEISGREQELRAELEGLPQDEPTTGDPRAIQGGSVAQMQDIMTQRRNRPEANRRRQINRELSQLEKMRFENPVWQRFLAETGSELDNDMQRVSQAQGQLSEGYLEGGQNKTGVAGAGAGAITPPDNSAQAQQHSKDYESYAAAWNMLNDAKKIIEAPSKYQDDEKGALSDFWKGVVDGLPEALSPAQLLKAGLNMRLVDAVKQIQAHEADGAATDIYALAKSDSLDMLDYLSDGEKELVRAFAKKADAERLRSGSISRSYQAGQGAIQSAGFMLDFAAFGGAGEAAAKAVAGDVVKAAGRNALAKLGAETLYGTIKSAAMTPLMPSSYANMVNNLLQFNDANGVDLSGEAIMKSVGDVMIETISETVGAKPIELLGMPLQKVKFPEWAKAMRHSPWAAAMKQAGYNGLFEEVVEEWTGNALRVMTGVDKDALKDFATVEQQLVTIGSFAPMSILGGTMSTAQFATASKAMKKAGLALEDVIAPLQIDEEGKKALVRQFSDNAELDTPEDFARNMAGVYQQIVDNGGGPAQAYNAVMKYTEAASRYKVMEGVFEEQKDIDRSRRLTELDEQMGDGNWHHTGSNGASFVRVITDADGHERFVVAEDEGGVALVDREGNKTMLNNEQLAQGIADGSLADSGERYLYDYLDRQTEVVKQQREQERMTAEAQQIKTELSRKLQPEMPINVGTAEEPEMGMILQSVAGQVIVQKPDGTTVIYTPEEAANRLGVRVVPETDAEIEAKEVALEEKRENIRAAFTQYHGQPIPEGVLTGVVRVQSEVTPFNVYYRDAEGREVVEPMSDEDMEAMLAELQARQAQASVAEIEPTVEVQDNIPRDFRGNPLPLRLNKRTGEQVVDGTALWNKDPEAWARWNDTNPNQKVSSKERLEFTVKQLNKEIEKDTDAVRKAALKGIDEDEMDAMDMALGEKVNRRDLLLSILNQYNVMAEAGDTFAGEKRKEQAAAVRQEQQAGFPGIQQRWNEAPKAQGMADEIRLPNGETVTGRYVLTEALAPTPSHDPANGFLMSEGFPVDENGKTVNDRDYEKDKSAQEAVLEKAAAYDQRALQTPVIVSEDGVVLSGNDRTMASHIAAANNTDTAYTDYLSKYPQKYGFTPEQVSSFQHPRVVFVPDVALPYDAPTFAKFNAEEKKSQNKAEKAVKAGKTLTPEALAALATLVDQYDDVNALYNDPEGVNELIKLLLSSGIISQEQVAALKDGDMLSGAGMDLLESTLIGAALDEEAVRVAMNDKAIRKAVVSAISQILTGNTLEGYTLRAELTDAITLVAKGKDAGEVKSGESVQYYVRQQHLFMDDVVAEATVQMLADAVNNRKTSFLKKVLSLYNRDAAESAMGQMNLFTEDVPTREAILRNILEYLGYDTSITYDTSAREAEQRAAAERRTEETAGTAETGEDGAPVQSDEGSRAGRIDREEAAVLLEQGNVGELADYLTDEEIAEFLRLYESFKPANDALGEAYSRLADELKSGNKNVKKAAEAEIAQLEAAQEVAFQPVKNFTQSLVKKYGIEEEVGMQPEAITGADKAVEVSEPEEVEAPTPESTELLEDEKPVVSEVNLEETPETPDESGQTVGELGKYIHTKTGKEMAIVRLTGERLSGDEFKALKKRAKELGGYYSSYGNAKGFLFDNEEDAIKFNTIEATENVEEQTDEQTAADTAAVVSEAASAAIEAESLADAESIEQERAAEAVARIDSSLEAVDNQLALLGYYEHDEEGPFHESYGYMKSAEKKAVKDADRLAKKLAADLGIDVGRKQLAKANIAPAGGDITFRLPLNEGRELYVCISMGLGEKDRDDLQVGGYSGPRGLDIMYRVENQSQTGADRFGRNYWAMYNDSYALLLRRIRSAAKDYLPEAPAQASGPVDVLQVVKEQAEKHRKSGKKTVSSQKDGDAALGGLFATLYDVQPESQEYDTPAPAAPAKPKCVNGYTVGEKVIYTPSQDREPQEATIYDFEYDGRPVLDAGLAPVLYEVVEWNQVKKIENEPVNTTDNGLQRNDEPGPEGLPADDSGQPGGLREGARAEGEGTEQEGGRADGGRDGESEEGLHVRQRPQRARYDDSVKRNTRNNRVAKGEVVYPKTNAARYKANIAAIRLLKELQDSGKSATSEQMAVLRQYTGWGGLGGYFNNTYSADYKELKSILTEEEMESAALSINTAYYTPVEVIDAMWDIARNLGFQGGNVLEGSAGIGNILASMPKGMSEHSAITAVELDSITGGILELLYPDANVLVKGFQDADIANNSVDLAITNVPFGNINVYDAKEKDITRKFGGKIHDFCIAKNIRKLAEGGIGIFITTRGTLDNPSKQLRQWIVNEGGSDVIGAFRLNNETFEGTGATSDIIVVRKRVGGKPSPNAIDISATEITRRESYETDERVWNSETRRYELVKGDATMEMNDYFVEHPENMGGVMGFGFEHGDTYRPGSSALWKSDKIDQQKRLNKWVKGFSNMQEEDVVGEVLEQQQTEESSATKEGELVVNSKGEICVSRSGKAVPLGVNAQKVKGYTKAQVLTDYKALKDAINEALAYQLNNESDEGLKPLLQKLNRAYDSFVRRYDRLNRNTAISFLRNDVDFPSVAAVEDFKEKKEITGKVKIEVKKTDIFKGRVLSNKRVPTPSTVKDGVIVSINRFGRIDLPFIASVMNQDEESVKKEIISSGLGFENPQTGAVDVDYEYLSGNVREKLEYAREHNGDGRYDANIKALEKVIPAEIPATLIEFSLGSDWLPVSLYTQYAMERFGLNDRFVPKSYGGMWSVEGDDYMFEANNEKNRSAGVTSESLGITRSGHELMLAAMNKKPVVFSRTYKDFDGTTHTETDKTASQNAATKIDEMRDDFKEWCRAKIMADDTLGQTITKTYNDTFNAIVPKDISDTFIPERFEGQVMEMDGEPFHLRKHQAKAAIRATTEPLMMAHEVGSGKTFTLVSAAMEMRRLGTAKKPMIVVQNATLGQFVSDAKELYPNAKILTINDNERTAEGRMFFYAKVKYNDWDMIIVPQSVFEMIPDSEERQRAFIQDKIDEKMEILANAKAAGDRNIVRQLENELLDLEYERDNNGEKRPKGKKKDAKKEAQAKENASAKAKKQLDRKTDEVSDFDDMGVDALLIDEAHAYKHLGFATSMQRGVKGVDPSYSKKSASVYLKTRSVFDKVGWKNVVFATGTPISNTAAEIWTFMKYLMPSDMMKALHIYYFDDFVSNFGNISQSLEFTTGGKFKENARFASYTNLPELIRIWSSVTDTVLAKDAKAEGGKKLKDKQPKMESWTDEEGKVHENQARDIYLPQSESLIDILTAVRKKLDWYDNLTGKEKKENSHIPLTMFTVAKMAAIDPRLVDKRAKDEPLSKTNRVVEETVKALKDSERYNGTAAIFCDNFRRWDTDARGNRVEGFNIFEEIKRKLVEAGVPADQIVIMKSGMSTSAKEKVLARVNSGEVRVIMGTTATLGTGVNIQERLFFAAHVDAPNRPMDYTQRNGRILRQGNLHRDWDIPVRVVRFGVEDSLDVTAYQRLSTKSKFINSIMNGRPLLENGMENRVLEEEEEVDFDNTVAVISGSQFAQLKSQAERELRKLRNKKEQHRQDQIYIENKLKENTARIATDRKLIEERQGYLARVKEAFPDGKVKEISIEGRKVKGQEQIAEAIKEKIAVPIREFIEKKRNDYNFHSEDKKYTMTFDGVPVDVNVLVSRSVEYNERMREMKTVMRTNVEYSCKQLGVNNKLIPGGYVAIKDVITDFDERIASGRYYENAIHSEEERISRLESDNGLMLQRRGKPFEDEEKLQKQEALVAEYTKKMKDEMAEKEAKYAELAKNATTSFNLDDVEVEDEDEGEGATHNREAANSAPRLNISDPLVVVEATAAVNRLARRLGISVKFDNDPAGGEKGSYREGTDYVSINLAACESVDDAVETLLHEGVAHFGLRKLLGEQGMAEFIDNVLKGASPSILSGIDAMAERGGVSREYAAEEYIAELAERTDYTRRERSLWREIVMAIRNAIDFILGRQTRIGEETIREMLIASYRNLESGPQQRLTTMEEALEGEGTTHYRLRTKPEPEKKGIGYKVFYQKDGKLYPPMVANPGGEATPEGVWLDAEAAPIVGKSKTGRTKVKAGGKGTQGGSGRLAYRPGWHLGEIPYAIQFNRLNPETGEKELFPRDFVWAEVEYAADVDYQKEAEAEGMTADGKYRHSYAGLPRVPEDGFYRYRTNPNPKTDPWIITGSMRVKRVLTNDEVDELVRAAGREPQLREGDLVRNRVAEGVEGFLSNAEEAVRGIQQEKATPQQWLKMIEGNGGLKAGEDRWIGLSDWLKSSDKKTITKQEIQDFINQNKIQIEEVNYAENVDIEQYIKDDIRERIAKGKSIEDLQGEIDELKTSAARYDAIGESDDRLDEYLMDAMKEEYGDDFELGYFIEDGAIDYSVDPYTLDADEYNKAVEGTKETKKAHTGRLDYTTKGLENKREIALTVPTIEPWNKDDTIHFGDAGDGRAVAWARFGDAVIGMNGKALFIDEIQSKRHQEGREFGYSNKDAYKSAAVGEFRKFTVDDEQFEEAEVIGKNGRRLGKITKNEDGLFYAENADGTKVTSFRRTVEEALEAMDRAFTVDGIPEAPFEKNWHELAMKRMLRYAAENGYDYVAWTTGDQQAKRYSIGHVIEGIETVQYHDGSGRREVYLTSPARPDIQLTVDKDGTVIRVPGRGSELKGKQLQEIIGKELAIKTMNTETDEVGNAELVADGQDLMVGGEGMKGFYDEILPRFMNKYGKKWGVQVEDKTLYGLENGPLKVHAVRITPEMKESVMKGQMMFRQGTVFTPSPVSYSESLGAKRDAAGRVAEQCGIQVEFKPSSQMQFNGKPLAGRWVNGKMYVCLEHCRDAADAVRTVLHEGVGHNGLRRLVGDENMTAFCLDMFRRLPGDARKEIAEAAVTRYGGNIAEAVEEYLAERAETMDFEGGEIERNFWDIVIDGLSKILAKLGINVPLSRRDVRWLMWQSYNANKQDDIFNLAKRQVVANRLGFTLKQQSERMEAVQMARNRLADEELASAASIYNKDVMNMWSRLHETWVDKDDAVHRLVEAIEKATGRKAESFEDVRLALNQQSSKGLAAMEKFQREHYLPMWDAIKALRKEKGCALKDIDRYVMLKHGLERNEVFAKRDAREFYQDIRDRAVEAIKASKTLEDSEKDGLVAKEDAKLERHFRAIEAGTDAKYKEFRAQDYGGITSMYSEYDPIEPFMHGIESEEEYQARVLQSRHPKYTYVDADGREVVDMAATEQAAEQETAEFEKGFDKAVGELWKQINGATKATLKHQYESNMISRDQYIRVRDMFKYYVPLRGFADNTAEDMYSYYQSDRRNEFTPPLLRAKGRKTEAESPFGYIGAMASSAIAADMKNETKLALYYFISNRANNDLVNISEVWYEKIEEDGDGKSVFAPVYPPLTEDLSSEEAKRSYEEWEKGMQEKAKAGLAFKGRKKLNLHNSVIHIDKAQAASHIIKFKVGGREMMMYINGNPRAAQAINNELNVEMSTDYQRVFGKILRWFSGINTSYNPEFWLSNAQRDALFAIMSVSAKEDDEYNRAFRKNYARILRSTLTPGAKGGVYSLKRKLDSGNLGNDRLDKFYEEFVENGGVTGYTTLKNNEEWELELRKYTGDEKAGIQAIKTAAEAVQSFGEAIEQMTRFAAYITSREQGREIKEAVADAKELTVNFNRKGSGKAITFKEAEKLTWKGKKLNGIQKAFVVAASWIPAYGRRFIIFFNASVQGLNNMYELFRKNPGKMGVWTAGFFALGVMQALIHAMMDDDDDYLDIPDYERRNNLLLGGNGVYFKWALPQEARVFYGMGDMIVNQALGRTPDKNPFNGAEELKRYLGDIGTMLGDIAPLNPSGGIAALAPSALSPIVEVALNRDYKGAKIFNDLRYLSEEERKRTPAYQRAFQGTGKLYISISEFANWMSGGDYADAGWLNINPAAVEHILQGATGGAGTTLGKLYRGTVGQVLGEDFTVRNTPFLSRILTVTDDRYRNAHTTELFDYYKAEAEHTKKLINTYRKKGDVEKLDRIFEGEDYEIMTIYESYRKLLEWYNEELKATSDSRERKSLMREQDAVRKEMIREISDIE